ncbi:hypothetical protein SEA_MOLLYMUR_45 [Gordonia phage Mollymur]|uniref:Uncharacterized protein n=1 Tax=Gordonia phage Mollymur TaxID=2590895 RepID=A0A4Y6EDL2_9CAUD|nr:hypothetical protein PQB84_gp080 [Gordonia phage Mollymur]QDF15406.1 hypothetical protein SEA_MOLLYMUR_45 [Gordonia phage Mollymur]
MPQQFSTDVNDHSPEQLANVFTALMDWMSAGKNTVRSLDAFGEHAAAERTDAVLGRLETLVGEALALPADASLLAERVGTAGGNVTLLTPVR